MRRDGIRRTAWLVLGACLALGARAAKGDEARPEERANAGEARAEAIRGAVERGLHVVQTAARNYPRHRQCYSCHHQTLPMYAMLRVHELASSSAPEASSVPVDDELFRSQYEFTRRSFAERQERLLKGEGIGGRSMTVAYGLWTFELADLTRTEFMKVRPDHTELAHAMVAYLLQNQEEDGRWKPPSHRPPLEESDVMCTILAAGGVKGYASPEQKEAADAAIERAKAWLASAPLASTEDHVARLWGADLFGEPDDAVAALRRSLLALQQEDGSWGQIPGMPGDAYATGQALAILLSYGSLPESPALDKGVDFLLSTQREDGSWFVETRSKPVQVFFDNGDPHGASQFISIAATSWAVTALASARP